MGKCPLWPAGSQEKLVGRGQGSLYCVLAQTWGEQSTEPMGG